MSLNVAAVRFLERHQAEDLRPMLGLVAEDGSIPPDDTNVYTFPPADKGPGAKQPDAMVGIPTRPKDRSAVPPSLKNLPPQAAEEPVKKRRGPKPQPKVIRQSKPRELAPCGTVSAYSRHRRRGEEVDQACLEANRAYGREKHREYRERKKREAERQRLMEAGVRDQQALDTLEVLAR